MVRWLPNSNELVQFDVKHYKMFFIQNMHTNCINLAPDASQKLKRREKKKMDEQQKQKTA